MTDNNTETKSESLSLIDIELNNQLDAKLTINELVNKIKVLAENQDPYLVSKEIERLKSLFYLKLQKQEKFQTKKDVNIDGEKDTNNELNQKKHISPEEVLFKKIYAKYKKVKLECRKQKEKEEKNNFIIKKNIITDIYNLTKTKESIKETFKHFRILQKKWKETGYVPQTLKNEIWKSYHHHVELFYDYIKINNDLRDLDFKRNLEEKTKICNKAEALMNEKSFKKNHQILQELHEHWKNIGPVKKELREEIWQRFQNISKILNKKRNDYFIQQKKTDKEKLKNKVTICKKIDNLSEISSSYKGWEEATFKCHDLEIEWKKIGRLNKADNKNAWKRLRSSLNNFYTKKNAFYKQKKEENKTVLEMKTHICKEAESLQNSTEWKTTTDQLIKLQKKWKNISYSSNNKSNKIWIQFNEACDTFFKRKKTYYKTKDKEQIICFKEKKELLNQLKTFKKTGNKASDIKKLNEFRQKWTTLGYVPIKKRKINDEFFSLINTCFKELGLNKKDLAIEEYLNKIKALNGNNNSLKNEKQFLLNKINNLKKDITQYENNMSFFTNNKGAEAFKTQVEDQIKEIKSEIEILKQKLEILNKG